MSLAFPLSWNSDRIHQALCTGLKSATFTQIYALDMFLVVIAGCWEAFKERLFHNSVSHFLFGFGIDVAIMKSGKSLYPGFTTLK